MFQKRQELAQALFQIWKMVKRPLNWENDYIASNIEACLEPAAYELFDVGFQDIQDMKQRIIKLVKEKQMRK